MGFDLEQICYNPPSSSSSTVQIFCNENFYNCSPCCCHSSCINSFLNDHTYSILKRVCHKIIKSYNRQQCREKYTVFDGGNSIYHRGSDRQKLGDGSDFTRETEAEYNKDPSRRDDRYDLKAINKNRPNKKADQDEEVDTSYNKYKNKTHNDRDKIKSTGKSTKDGEFGEKDRNIEYASKATGRMKKDRVQDIDDSPKVGKGGGDKRQLDSGRGKKDGGDSEPPKKSGEKDRNIENASKATGKMKKEKDQGKDDSPKVGKGGGDKKQMESGRRKKDADDSEPLKKSNKSDTKTKEDIAESAQKSERKSKMGKGGGKKDEGDGDLVPKSKKPGSSTKGGRGEKNRNDTKNPSTSDNVAEKGKKEKKDKEKVGGSPKRKGKQSLIDETGLDGTLTKGKRGTENRSNKDKGQLSKNKQDRQSEKIKDERGESKLGGKLKKHEKAQRDTKRDTKAAGDGPSKSYERNSRKGPGADERERGKSTADTHSTRPQRISGKIRDGGSSGYQHTGKRKDRSEFRKTSKYRIQKGVSGSKFIQEESRSSRNRLYSRRPCRGDEVRACDILRVHLEQRDLSRCKPCAANPICRPCTPSCMPCNCFVC